MSKRRKANQQQPRETDSATDEHSYIIEDSPSVIADTCRRTASLKRSRNSMPTATKSQEPTVEGIAFPPNFQESISKTSTIAETARLHAEIEELKRSVQALLASNKNLREEQAVKTQKIVDSDGSRAHNRFATSTTTRKELPRREVSREMPIEIPNQNALHEEPPTMAHNSTSMPTFATKSVGLSASLSDKESSGEESSACSRRLSRKQRRAKYMRYYVRCINNII